MSQQTPTIPAPIAEALDAAAKRRQAAHQRTTEYRQACQTVEDIQAAYDELKRQMEDARARLGRAQAEADRADLVAQDTWSDARRYQRMAELIAAEEGIALPDPQQANGTGPQPAVTSGGHPVLTAAQIRVEQGLPPKGGPVPLDPGVTQAWRPAGVEQPDSPEVTRRDMEPGGEAPPEASFHRGDPDAGQADDA